MEKISIGAAIITKNEEKNIVRCLNSLIEICNQIVVVDTGSSDKTIEIVTPKGVNLFYKKWSNDFSEARNYAIRHLHTDWILSIDADEEIVENNMSAELNNIIQNNGNVGGVSVIINNFLDEDLLTSKKHNYTRIFRNDKRIMFEGKIHEQVATSIKNIGLQIVESNIIINHFGYIGKNIEKEGRNRDLLVEEINKNSEDDFLKYHLAMTDFSIGNKDEAFKLLSELIASNTLSDIQNEEIRIKLGQIFLEKNEFEKAAEILDFKANNIDNEGLRKNILGIAYIYLKDIEKSFEYYYSDEISKSKLVSSESIENGRQLLKMIKTSTISK
jgi:glycosyltransferase involved in cell wall biosynthesis